MNDRPKKIGVLIESHFDDTEFVVFNEYFAEHGYEVEYLSYLWGQSSLTFDGNEGRERVTVNRCVTTADPKEYAGVILIGGYAMDRLRYESQPCRGEPNRSEGVKFLRRCVDSDGLKIGTICHSLWLFAAAPDLLKGRKVTCAHNIVSDVEHAGGDIQFGDDGTVDLCIDGDLISAKHPAFSKKFVEVFLSEIVGGSRPSSREALSPAVAAAVAAPTDGSVSSESTALS